MKDTIIWAKVKPEAIIPTKRQEDAGLDIYACFEYDFMTIKPHETALIPTGIASAFSDSWYIQIEERGGLGSKGIGMRCGVIDSGYRSTWFIALTNHNNKHFVIHKTMTDELQNRIAKMIGNNAILHPITKGIAQAIILPVPKLNHTEVTYEELLLIKSERGIGSLGSSQK